MQRPAATPLSFFRTRIREKLADPVLQGALRRAQPLFVGKRTKGMASLTADGLCFETQRDAAAAIRQRVLDDLDVWLEIFEARARATGAEVRWARNGAEIREQVLAIARAHGVRKVVKSKSMLSEEADLNAALAAAGIASIETDLGEYIVQLAQEPPSHIIAPAVHKTRDEVADLFAEHHGRPRQTDIPGLAGEARAILREHFLTADMGISGANFLIAETGSAALVTNEGNGRMVTTLPRVHVVITGIEKIVPTLDDFATLMRLLPRSATGQNISNYVSVLTGTRRGGDSEGAATTVFILVDNGRASLLGTPYAPMLRCIRCGACMNHCPVYFKLGGHAYGWVYPGPMGSVLTPLLTGLDQALDLPRATTGCDQCGRVCPVGIPLPDLMRRLREDQSTRGLRPRRERRFWRLWGWLARHPRWYRWASRWISRGLRGLANAPEGLRGRVLPAWTESRDLPVPAAAPFHEQYARRQRGRDGNKR